MKNLECKTVNQAIKEIRRISNAYATVFDNEYINADMETYIKYQIIETVTAMKLYGKYSFEMKFHIRHRGAEMNYNRIAELNDKCVGTIFLNYNKDTNIYTVYHFAE